MVGGAIRKAIWSIAGLRQVADEHAALVKEVAGLRQVADEHAALVKEVAGLRQVADEHAALVKELADLKRQLTQEAIHQKVPFDLAVQKALEAVRAEYTMVPRFAYHLPFDYEENTLPPKYDPPVWVQGEELPLPPRAERHGEAETDLDFLNWGKGDRDDIFRYIHEGLPSIDNLRVIDFGCSSGRVMRHFWPDAKSRGWKLIGVDVSARHIEWMRRNFPKGIELYTGSFMPILPFESNSIDVIYGMSVFTHIKYLWDLWLLEMRRVLKPGGLLIQSVQTERAWDFFSEHNQEPWVRDALGTLFVDCKEMPDDFVYYGNLDKNQVFWKKKIVLEFWGRYFRDVVMQPPTKTTYQDWIVARK